MPLADDASGILFQPVYHIPGNPTIGNAPDPTQPLGLTVIDLSDPSDDLAGYVGPQVVRGKGFYGGVMIDPGAWYVDQFWIRPSPVAYGNIFSDKTISTTVLNSFRYQDFELTTIDEAALTAVGVSVSSGPARPALIRRSATLEYDFTAALAGTPSFDVPTDFTFNEV